MSQQGDFDIVGKFYGGQDFCNVRILTWVHGENVKSSTDWVAKLQKSRDTEEADKFGNKSKTGVT